MRTMGSQPRVLTTGSLPSLQQDSYIELGVISNLRNIQNLHEYQQMPDICILKKKRLTLLSSSMALSFSFNSSFVVSRCPVSHFSFIWWLETSFFSVGFFKEFCRNCPSSWLCLRASKSFFICKAQKKYLFKINYLKKNN